MFLTKNLGNHKSCDTVYIIFTCLTVGLLISIESGLGANARKTEINNFHSFVHSVLGCFSWTPSNLAQCQYAFQLIIIGNIQGS
jgi:hypothetical protein